MESNIDNLDDDSRYDNIDDPILLLGLMVLCDIQVKDEEKNP